MRATANRHATLSSSGRLRIEQNSINFRFIEAYGFLMDWDRPLANYSEINIFRLLMSSIGMGQTAGLLEMEEWVWGMNGPVGGEQRILPR